MSQKQIDSPSRSPFLTTLSQHSPAHSSNQQQTQISNDKFSNYEHQLAIQIMAKIAVRFHSRKLMKNLIFANISALKNTSHIRLQQNQIVPTLPKTNKVQIDWPFKDLHYKRYKTQQQQFLYEFVSMCATKIQAKFKAFIVSKRHKKAMLRFRKFTMALRAITKGWKTRRIYNCPKMLEMRQKIKNINQIITYQQQKPDRSAKKLQYLIDDVQYNTKVFQDYFAKLSGNGRWVYEIDKSIVYVSKKSKIPHLKIFSNKVSGLENSYITKQYEVPQQQLQQSKPIKKARKRQFQKPKVNNRTKQNQPYNSSQIQSIPTRDTGNNPFDEIPIKAKGNYDYENVAMLQQNTISDEKQIKDHDNETQNKQKDKSQKNKTMNEQRKKLQKRQKYDPRKAIEEQKQRKKNVKIQSQENKYLQEKKDNTPIKREMQPQTKTPKNLVQNSKKTVKAPKNLIQNSQISKNSTVSATNPVSNKPNKHEKPEPKIINWKKKISQSQNAVNGYANHRNNKSKEQYRSQSPIFIKNNSYIHKIQINRQQQSLQKNQSQEPKVERTKLHSLIQQRLKKKSEQVKVVSEHIDSTKKKQEMPSSMMKEDKYKRIQGNMNKIIQKLADTKQKEVYRPVEQLIETYNNQYSVRYESILPKLGMLSASRSCQHRKNQQSLSESVPVLSQDSIQVLKSLYQNIVVTAFWQALSKKQRCFKEFLMN